MPAPVSHLPCHRRRTLSVLAGAVLVLTVERSPRCDRARAWGRRSTTGTATNASYSEHAFNWDVAVKLKVLLVAKGITVIMTRFDDSDVDPCVNERAAIGNRAPTASTPVAAIQLDSISVPSRRPCVNWAICDRQPTRRFKPATAVVPHEQLASLRECSVISRVDREGTRELGCRHRAGSPAWPTRGPHRHRPATRRRSLSPATPRRFARLQIAARADH